MTDAQEPTEAELLAAWEAANKEWQGDVFNAEKEQAVSLATFRLNVWRRIHTPEGRAYADSAPTYKDVSDDPGAEEG